MLAICLPDVFHPGFLAATATEYVRVVIIAVWKPTDDNDCNNNPDPGINSVIVITVATW